MDTKTQQTGQHTPGPWTIRTERRTRLVCDEHGNQISAIRPVKRYGVAGDDAANARLIAAAPTMYEGIGDFLAAYDRARIGEWDHGKLIDWLGEQVARLRFVYAKAEGR